MYINSKQYDTEIYITDGKLLEEMSKGENSKMDKGTKDKLVRSTGENGGG